MKKPYTILLPVDYSSQSEYACRFALHLCKDLPAELQIIHVYRDPIPDASNPMLYAVDLSKIYNLERSRLEKYVLEILDKFGYKEDELRIKLEVLEGDIALQIAQYAHHQQSDLILVGTHDRHEIREYLWGTHTVEIVRQSEVPVLAIPEGCIYRDWRKILYATNLRHLEFPIIEFIVNMSKRVDAILEIMHVETEEDDKWEKVAEFDEFKNDIFNTIDYDKLRMNSLHEQVRIADSLMQYSEENGIDMIAIAPSRSSITERVFGKHVTKDLLYKAHLPILCVKY